VIRLGSQAGYPFEGPRVLVGWSAPKVSAVYAIMFKPNPETKPQEFAVIYVGHSDDLSKENFPLKHRHAPTWIERAGSKWNLHVCFYEVLGGLRSHREQIARELMAAYKPSCNLEKYDQAWKAEWIGEYSAPTTGPLTTDRDPNRSG